MELGEQLDRLTPVERTLLLTRCGRANDAKLATPLLGDTVAEEISGKFCESDRATGAGADLSVNVAIRTAQLDQHVRNFLVEYPNAIIVELGCGLETRNFRLDLPSRANYYCIDSPAVIEL